MALRGVDEFIKQISLFVPTEVNGAVEATQRNCAFSIFDRAVKRTPVHLIDGGRLRGNWQITVGVVPAGEVGARSDSATVAAGKAVMRASPTYSTIFITNNVPYARNVEFGLYPKIVKLGTYIPKRLRGKVSDKARVRKRNADGEPTHVQFSAGGFSRQADQGMVRVSFEEVGAILDTLAQAAASGIDLTKVT